MSHTFNIVRPSADYDANTKEFSCSPNRDQAIISSALATCFGSGAADKMIVSSCKSQLGVAQCIIVDATVRIKGTLKTSKPRICNVRAKDNCKAALIDLLDNPLVPQAVKDSIRHKYTAESARKNGIDVESMMTAAQPNTKEIINGMTTELSETVEYAPSVSGTIGWDAVSHVGEISTLTPTVAESVSVVRHDSTYESAMIPKSKVSKKR